jgi:hypothetical protein
VKCPKCGYDDKPEPLALWYMRDNHTFVSLPLDPDEAAEKITKVLKEEAGRCGMLCSHQYKGYVHHDYTAPDEKSLSKPGNGLGLLLIQGWCMGGRRER